MKIISQNACFWSKIDVFEAKGSEIGQTKIALAAKAAMSFDFFS
jgi:hypothetical protein